MSIASLTQLSDRDLLDAVAHAAKRERHATVDLIRLLAELDARKLYLGEGCSSLFTYCTQVLHLSEHAAYHRIEAARAARQFPVVLDLLAEGALTLTTLALLRPHLTPANHELVLTAARFKSKREVEHQIACLAPRPDERPIVQKLPGPLPARVVSRDLLEVSAAVPPLVAEPPSRAVVAPTATDRYLVKVTVSAATHAKFRRAQDLLRHTIPGGDHAAILDRALTLLVDHLERQKVGRVRRDGSLATPPNAGSKNTRYIPPAVRRSVWARDEGRCAFEGPRGRCRETGRLEFHHLVPFARGGRTEIGNLALRCRAHNQFEGETLFGPHRTRSGPSGLSRR
jgi:5-methylcytosine-specific restriction endonuclease McrA